jgi:hypothetical protein
MDVQERINFMRGIKEQVKVKKESNVFYLVSHMKKGERKEQTALKSTRKKTQQNYQNRQ